MPAPKLRTVLKALSHLLVSATEDPTDSALETPIAGLELYSGAAGQDLVGKIVLVGSSLSSEGETARVLRQCRDAAAVIVAAEPGVDARPGETVAVAEPGSAPVLLRRVPGTSIEELLIVILGALSGESPAFANQQPQVDHDAVLATRRQETALLVLLDGTPDSAAPATLLGLRPDRDHVVVAASVGSSQLETYRLALRAEFPTERSVLSNSVVYTVIPLDLPASSPDARPTEITARLRARLGRAIRSGEDLPVGVGTVVPGAFALHESAAVARETLRALRFRLGVPWQSEYTRPRVAGTQDVSDALALIRAGDALRPHGAALAEPLMQIARYDREHGSELLASVLAALEYRGNMTLAASQLGIHPNSLRARLARVKDISGVDLDEPVSAMRAIVAFLSSPDAHHAARPWQHLLH